MIRPSIRLEHPRWTTELVRYYDGAEDTPVALEALTIHWGREEWLDERKPVTADFRLLVNNDSIQTTAKFFRYRQEIPVKIAAAGMTLFKGYVTEVKARKTQAVDSERYIFDVTAVDSTSELFSHKSHFGKSLTNASVQGQLVFQKYLPELLTKFPRLKAAITTLTFPQWVQKTPVLLSAPALEEITIWSYVTRLYKTLDGMGWEWNPANGEIYPQPAPTGLTDLTSVLARTVRGLEIAVDTTSATSSGDVVELDAGALRIDELGFTIPPRMDVGYIDASIFSPNERSELEEVTLTRTVGTGSRTVSNDGLFSADLDKHSFEESTARFGEHAKQIGKYPELPRVRYHFTDLDKKSAEWWLTPRQTTMLGLIQNSALFEWLSPAAAYGADGYSPAVAVIGGVITFTGKQWEVEQNLVTVPAEGTVVDNPVTYSTLNEARYTIGNYSPNTAWREFAALPKNNTFKEK